MSLVDVPHHANTGSENRLAIGIAKQHKSLLPASPASDSLPKIRKAKNTRRDKTIAKIDQSVFPGGTSKTVSSLIMNLLTSVFSCVFIVRPFGRVCASDPNLLGTTRVT